MPKSRFLAAVVGVCLLGAAAGAHAQTTVDVTATAGASTRTLHVEDMGGNALTSIDFGSGNSAPFRVRVVDSAFARQSFSVSATMTNLYKDNNGTLDMATKIDSSNVSLASQLNPLNILEVSAKVGPLVDTVSTVTDSTVCSTLGLVMTLIAGVNACQMSAANLTGQIQDLSVPVNLADLTNLPLLPQPNETGAFTFAEYAAGTAGENDPDAVGADPATSKRLVSGAPVATATVLSALDALIVETPLSTLVDRQYVEQALAAQFPETWALLTSVQIDTIVASTIGTADALTGAEVLSQTGTYISLPTLDLNVPTSATAGSYKGTLVVTALQ